MQGKIMPKDARFISERRVRNADILPTAFVEAAVLLVRSLIMASWATYIDSIRRTQSSSDGGSRKPVLMPSRYAVSKAK